MTAAREHAGTSPIAERFAGGLTKALDLQRSEIVDQLARRQDAATAALRDQLEALRNELDELRADLDEARAQADRADARTNAVQRELRRVRRRLARARWSRLAGWFGRRARFHEAEDEGR